MPASRSGCAHTWETPRALCQHWACRMVSFPAGPLIFPLLLLLLPLPGAASPSPSSSLPARPLILPLITPHCSGLCSQTQRLLSFQGASALVSQAQPLMVPPCMLPGTGGSPPLPGVPLVAGRPMGAVLIKQHTRPSHPQSRASQPRPRKAPLKSDMGAEPVSLRPQAWWLEGGQEPGVARG